MLNIHYYHNYDFFITIFGNIPPKLVSTVSELIELGKLVGSC